MDKRLLGRVIRTFMGGFSKTITEDVIGAALILLAVVNPWFSGKKAPGWASFEEGTAAVCTVLAYHVIRAIAVVWRDIKSRMRVHEEESVLYWADNKKTRHLVREEPPPRFRLKLVAIGVFCTLGLVAISLTVRAFARSHLGPDEVERAHLEVEQVTVDIETTSLVVKVWWNLWVNIRGHNRSITPKTRNPMVSAAIKITTPLQSAKEEEKVFNDQSLWANEGYMKPNGILYPQEEFAFNKHENLPLLDKGDFLNPETANGLRDGTLIVYVFTKTHYGDKYGPVPEDRTCRIFKYDEQKGFVSAGVCWLVFGSLANT